MSRWLVSHFEPFNGASSNSSQIVAKAVSAEFPNLLFTETLPTSFRRSWQVLETYLNSNSDVRGVLALGQSDGRKNISLERHAVNWQDAYIPDADGERPVDVAIKPGQPDLWTSLAVRPWVSPNVQISYSAGTYVCNSLYYHLLQWSKQSGKPALFIHIPLLVSQKEPQFSGLAKMPDETAINEIQRIFASLP